MDFDKTREKVKGSQPPNNVVELPPENPFGDVTDDRLRKALSAGHLRTKKMPVEDHIFVNSEGGGILSTIDYGQVFGDTGTGKTLFAVALAVAAASGSNFLHWECTKPRKVIYFDGELAEITMAERLELAMKKLSAGEQSLVEKNLTIFNRDTAFNELNIELEPLDSLKGRLQTEYLVDLIDADMAIFDSRFCLLKADMKEEGSMSKALIHSLRRRRCQATWVHHTGKDTTRGGYGDKSAEFLMDFNVELSTTDAVNRIEMTWRKKRKRNELNGDLYADLLIECSEGTWYSHSEAPVASRKTDRTRTNENLVMSAVTESTIAAKDAGRAMSKSHTRKQIHNISREKVREWTINHGHYEAVDGVLAKSERESINKAIRNLIGQGVLAGDKDGLWLIHDA